MYVVLVRRMEISDEMPDEKLQEVINEYTQIIDDYKYNLYMELVAKSTNPNTDSNDPLYKYNSLYLQSIAYWMNLLDYGNLPEPYLNGKLKTQFENITKITKNIINTDQDNRVIAYNILLKKSIERPEFFNNRKKNELKEEPI